MKDISAFYKVMSASAAKWIDNDSFAFIGDQSGAFQVWKGFADGRGAEQLSFDENRVWNLGGCDKDKNIYFTMDTGGDEQEQIYRIDSVTGEIRNLTNNPAARHNFGGVTPDGKYVICACNGRNPANFDICRIDIESEKIEIILENHDNYNTPASLSPNGKYLLYNKVNGMADNFMWILDIENKTAKKVCPSMTDCCAKNPVWDKCSSGFYFLTDFENDFLNVAHYDVKTDSMKIVYGTTWDIDEIAMSCDERYFAMDINENGYFKLKVWDMLLKTEINHPQIPKASGGSMAWSPDGHKLLFTLTSGKRASDIWVLDIDADSLKRVTNSPMGGISKDDLAEPELHSFKSFDGATVPFWVHRKQKTVNRVVIDIHGGPEGQEKPIFKPLTAYLVSRGFTVVAPNVRGSVGYGKKYHHLDDVEKRMDSVKDIEALVAHIIKEGIANQGQIAVMGGSYGGFMTLASITEYPALFACAVDTVGICNFETFLENTSSYRRVHRESEYGTLKNDREVLRRISPIHKVDSIACPLMVIHGARDPRVPISEAEQVVANLNKRGITVKYLRYEDEGHGLAKLKNKLDCYPQVAEFLNEHLK